MGFANFSNIGNLKEMILDVEMMNEKDIQHFIENKYNVYTSKKFDPECIYIILRNISRFRQ